MIDDPARGALVTAPAQPFTHPAPRVALPLSYVELKVEGAILEIHELSYWIRERVPDTLVAPGVGTGHPLPFKDAYLLGSARAAFHQLLVAYTALHNRTDALNPDPTLQLLTGTRLRLKAWLRAIQATGTRE